MKESMQPRQESSPTLHDRFSRMLSAWLHRTWYGPLPPSGAWLWHHLLAVGAALYARGLQHDQRRAIRRRRELSAYVLSVGNLVVGGTGKTPLCLWLARHLHHLGYRPAILSRGYRRRHDDLARVPSGGESSRAVSAFGDEPVLLARRAKPIPVWVSRDRWQAGTFAVQNDDANLLILDDGFQHLGLKRDLDLVLLDARSPLGNGALLPLGPLREPPGNLARADAIVLTRADDPGRTAKTRAMISRLLPGKPAFACRHRLTGLRVGLTGQLVSLEALRGKKVVAFAGIARPETFFHLLQEAGMVICDGFPFPDHHRYRDRDFLMLRRAMAESETAFLVTTEKDLVRLPQGFQTFTLAALLELDFGSDHGPFCNFLREKLPPASCDLSFFGDGNVLSC